MDQAVTHEHDMQPGYRRRIRIEPGAGHVRALLEDDFHSMAVTLHIAEGIVTAVEPEVERAPWTTCPGAEAQLRQTFTGLPLAEVTARRDKKSNCTHLHDIAVLAAAHASDEANTSYDFFASDPVDGVRILELLRGGELLLRWREHNGVLEHPTDLAGRTLPTLRDWIAGLPVTEQEPARLLQWASMVAHGRLIPMDQQSTASALPANCYTLQPERAAVALRVGRVFDFSDGSRVPLAVFDERIARD